MARAEISMLCGIFCHYPHLRWCVSEHGDVSPDRYGADGIDPDAWGTDLAGLPRELVDHREAGIIA
jgi:hypothetical protein